MVRRKSIVPLWFLEIGIILTQEVERAVQNPLLESPTMPQRQLFRFLLLAVLGLLAGLAALAIAVPIEPQIPAALVALFSPGLKLAELLAPETHRSLAWTFSWFLRIAIAANATFYFALFALLASAAVRKVAPARTPARFCRSISWKLSGTGEMDGTDSQGEAGGYR
jgi:hypothetical protein